MQAVHVISVEVEFVKRTYNFVFTLDHFTLSFLVFLMPNPHNTYKEESTIGEKVLMMCTQML